MTTDRDQRRARTLDDPAFERLRRPELRRRLAATLVGLIVVEAGLFVLLDYALIPAVIALAAVVLAFVVCLGALKASTRGVEELPEEVLDERQIHLRGQVYVRAYRVGATLLTIGLAVVVAWTLLDLPALGTGTLAAAVVVPFHLAIVLPTLVAGSMRDL